ncbi:MULTISPECIES: hypothetical protein [Paenibacillus]|uniref:hypothetical protein n=1 Tax=Paenibacillus TaxID=44249 RepID=UPI00203AD3C6|nr:hypothetical protein [Paenibacillus lactis]MCM3495971.1 hypothetical protein [Paenibacillus lactis]
MISVGSIRFLQFYGEITPNGFKNVARRNFPHASCHMSDNGLPGNIGVGFSFSVCTWDKHPQHAARLVIGFEQDKMFRYDRNKVAVILASVAQGIVLDFREMTNWHADPSHFPLNAFDISFSFHHHVPDQHSNVSTMGSCFGIHMAHGLYKLLPWHAAHVFRLHFLGKIEGVIDHLPVRIMQHG